MTYELPPIGHALSGGVAAALANVVIYPLDMATTRKTTRTTITTTKTTTHVLSSSATSKKRVHYTSVPDAIRKIYASEGFSALYSGLGSDTIATLTSNFVYFYVYMALRQRKEHRRSSGQLSTFQELFLGAEAGIISRFFTAPIHVVTTRQQVMGKDLLQQQGNSGTTGKAPKVSARSIIREIYAQDGITGFWAGYAPTVILSINPSITYFLFETIKKTILARQLKAAHSGSSSPSKSILAAAASLTSLQIFFISACSKAIASFLTYPLILTKTKLQTKVQDNESTTNPGDLEKQEDQPKSFNGISDVFKTVIKDKGIAGLYTGCQGQVVKGFFSFGLMYMIKDRVVAWMLTLFLAVHNMRNRVTSS
ncbi:MAG: mitochondrial carrier domain-containing protein [Linnemannia elongata]|nr:MAG: mitochondrial carrier domain-containing protein [Linnemannia elongata]